MSDDAPARYLLGISIVCAVGEIGAATLEQVQRRLAEWGFAFDAKTMRRLLDTVTNRGGHLMRVGSTWEVRP